MENHAMSQLQRQGTKQATFLAPQDDTTDTHRTKPGRSEINHVAKWCSTFCKAEGSYPRRTPHVPRRVCIAITTPYGNATVDSAMTFKTRIVTLRPIANETPPDFKFLASAVLDLLSSSNAAHPTRGSKGFTSGVAEIQEHHPRDSYHGQPLRVPRSTQRRT